MHQTAWMARIRLQAWKAQQYVQGETRCGYCGIRAWSWHSRITQGCYRWIVCHRCHELGAGSDVMTMHLPPYYARKKKVCCGRGCDAT